jgi:intraflagellar transport protein 56
VLDSPAHLQVIAGQETKDSLKDVLVMLRNTSNPQVEYIVRTVQKWCKSNGISV